MRHLQRSQEIISWYLQYHLFLPGGMKQNLRPVFLTNGYNFNFSKCECQIHPLCQIDLSSDLAHLKGDGTLQKHIGEFKELNVTVWMSSSIQYVSVFCHTHWHWRSQTSPSSHICDLSSCNTQVSAYLPQTTSWAHQATHPTWQHRVGCIQTSNRSRKLVLPNCFAPPTWFMLLV